jgi:GntR family transcriptional repressor for pyruvate dehydrogenase complex
MQLEVDKKLSRPPKLSEQAAQLLADEIAKGSLRPGEALPSEAKLASQLGVSRTIVREALARLEFEGVLEARKGTRAKVAVSGKRRVFRLRDALDLNPAELEQLYEFRAILEGAAAALAARRCSKKNLQRLKKCVFTLNDAVEKKIDHLPANVQFHQLIAEASGNSYLQNFMAFLNEKIWEQIRGDRDQIGEPGMPRDLQKEHIDIFNAIEKRDAQKARKAVMHHIAGAARRRDIPMDIL